SNRDLEEAVCKGEFREDLYFRLNVVAIQVTPLRDRPKDIQVLAEHFLKKYAEANGVADMTISPEAMAVLETHHWRGNARELENTMHRAVLMAQDKVVLPEAIHLTGMSLQRGNAEDDTKDDTTTARIAQSRAALAAGGHKLVGRTVADVERDLIIDTLQHCLGNRTHAANILGISIRTLRNKLRLYTQDGVPVPMPGETMPSSA
ncbi:MAG: helix-turn-helix domain-containing protein, partial [Alphaproteobacteria bacterium]